MRCAHIPYTAREIAKSATDLFIAALSFVPDPPVSSFALAMRVRIIDRSPGRNYIAKLTHSSITAAISEKKFSQVCGTVIAASKDAGAIHLQEGGINETMEHWVLGHDSGVSCGIICIFPGVRGSKPKSLPQSTAAATTTIAQHSTTTAQCAAAGTATGPHLHWENSENENGQIRFADRRATR